MMGKGGGGEGRKGGRGGVSVLYGTRICMNGDICGDGATRANTFSKQIGIFIPVTICTTTSLNDGGGELKTVSAYLYHTGKGTILVSVV